MRAKHLWMGLVVALGVALGYWWSHRGPTNLAPQTTRTITPSHPKPPVAIEDQKTIDFSNGKAVVKDSAEDKAVIDKAVKEMDAATKDVTFGPTPAADPKKKSDPAPTPSK